MAHVARKGDCMSDIDKTVELINGFVEAATPVVQQAYEVGLLTLRIDAASQLIPATIFIIFCVMCGNKTYKRLVDLDDSIAFFSLPVIALAIVFSALTVFDFWLWVKLFAPDLWLAHQAIEMIVR